MCGLVYHHFVVDLVSLHPPCCHQMCLHVCSLVCCSLDSCPKPFSERENHPKYNQSPISSACNFHSQNTLLTYSPLPASRVFFFSFAKQKVWWIFQQNSKISWNHNMKKNSHFSSEKKTYPPRQTPPPQSNNLTAETLMLAKIKPFGGPVLGLH